MVFGGISYTLVADTYTGIAKQQESEKFHVLVCHSCHNKNPRLGVGLEGGGGATEKFIFSQFWRTEVQGVRRPGFSRGLSPWLADGRLLVVFSHGLSQCVHIPAVSSSY